MTNDEIILSWSHYPLDQIEAFGDEGDFSRQYLLNPTLFKLLGNVTNKHILDAGSGTGYLSRKLARAGAIVTAIEPADNMIQYARQREDHQPLGITYLQADLSTVSLKPSNYDIVVCNMVLMDIPQYQEAIANCIRTLRPGGKFIFSISHPCFDEEDSRAYLNQGYIKVANYLHERQDSATFGKTFHRPLSTYIRLCLEHGLSLEELIEPQLSDKIVADFPKHIRNAFVPSFLVLGWKKGT